MPNETTPTQPTVSRGEIEKLIELEKKAELVSPTWDGLKIDSEGYVFVPQCSYLGSTLICMGDVYEGGGNDALYIQELLRCAPALLSLASRAEEAERGRDNLLCRIHGDGGHYISNHGPIKALEDAHKVVIDNRTSLQASELRAADLEAKIKSFEAAKMIENGFANLARKDRDVAELRVADIEAELNLCRPYRSQYKAQCEKIKTIEAKLSKAVGALEDIAEGDPFRNLPYIASNTLAEIGGKGTPT